MSSYTDIFNMVDEIVIFDTHEHMAGFDWGFATEDAPVGQTHPHKTLPHVLMNDMLLYITGCLGIEGLGLSPEKWRFEEAAGYWRAMQPALEELRGAAVYTTIQRGFKELYGFEGDDINDDNWEELNQKVVANYKSKGAAAWMLEVMQRARVKAIIQMAHLPYLLDYWPSLEPERSAREKAVVKPCLILEPFFFSGGPDRSKARERTMELLGMHPTNYSEHLEFMHTAIQRHKQAGGAAVKILCAYQRTLYFEEVPDAEARRLYDKGPENLDTGEMHRLQDNLVWHLMRMVDEIGLPVQIHTGYSTPTSWGDPENLLNLTSRFQSVQFYFCHAGWPNYGGLALMARTFANVHFGFCWMPALSPALAMRLMDEMFDLVPANKLLMGMDCGSIESFYGTTVMTRELVARVLAAKIDTGLISRRAATTIAHRFLHDNAQNLFGKSSS